MEKPRIVRAGDSALLVEFAPRIDPATSARVIALAEAVRARQGTTVRDVVVGYCTLTVYFDPLAVDADHLAAEIAISAADVPETISGDGPLIDVPVCYGGALGPDLADVASRAECSEDDVVALHTSRIYRVYVVGFVPGFPYMAAVDPRIAFPRRTTPRTKVPAGSVAIAAGQTGIYPMETPGGWHLLGRTPLRPYDPARRQPFLFRPGDRVRFYAVDRAEFDRVAAEA